MYDELNEETYGCFRCGGINKDYHHDMQGYTVCEECGEVGTIVTLETAFDIINECVSKGYVIYGPSIYDEDGC